MAGHGHVIPNADGTRARCGGPGICGECALEYVALHKPDQPKATATATLEAKTIALRDAGIAYKRAQEEYRAALEAFNRFVAPEPG